MFEIIMIAINILTICILVRDWRVEGKGGELVFPAGTLRLIILCGLGFELLTNAAELL